MLRLNPGRCAAIIILSAIAPLPAFGEISIFELRITNNTDRDLTFRLKKDHSKKIDLTYNKKYVPEYTIKPGKSETIGLKPDGD